MIEILKLIILDVRSLPIQEFIGLMMFLFGGVICVAGYMLMTLVK